MLMWRNQMIKYKLDQIMNKMDNKINRIIPTINNNNNLLYLFNQFNQINLKKIMILKNLMMNLLIL